MAANGSNLISIVIVNWNTRDLLSQCLQSIRSNVTGAAYEVIVVDNASSDGSAEMLRADFPWVRVIENRENRGFGAANNQGAAVANGNRLLFLNPDTLVSGNAITAMRGFLATHEDAGVVGCTLLNGDGSVQPSWWLGFPSVWWCWKGAVYAQNTWPTDRTVRPDSAPEGLPVSHLLGACIMVPKGLFDQLGGFDERYFLYLEETDLCFRAIKHGKLNYYLSEGSIVHFGQQGTVQGADWTNVQLQFSTYAFIRQHTQLSAVGKILLMLGMEFGCLVRIALWTARLIVGRRKRDVSLLMLRGYGRVLLSIPRFEVLLRRNRGNAVKLP